MKKLTTMLLCCLAVQACGEGSPTGVDEPPTLVVTEYVTLQEFDGYIADVQGTIPNVNLMIGEFGSIAGEFAAGFIPVYWIGEYTKNLLRRVDDIQGRAREIRPAHPELLKLHLEEYEASLEDFHAGFTLFVQGIEQPGSVTTEQVNDKIVEGNVHLIRLQILLGDLGGRPIDFFAPQGGGGNGPPNGEFDGFGF
ncbi:MAG: hypothetical protein CME19_22615 [Gemmatimonadetes bacterium]|nr:hypothetical protein [Gemmatimonadota bacterium]